MLQRNRRIERVERIVRLGEADIERHPDPFVGVLRRDGQIPHWSTLKLSDMVRFYGLAFLPYQRLRVAAVTDTLADQLGERWGIDRDSDHQYALRALVRVWREEHFNDEGEGGRATINAYLDEFDLDYRLRRLGFLLRKTDQLTRLFRRRRQGPIVNARGTDEGLPGLGESDVQIADRLPPPYNPLGPALEDATIDAALLALRSLKAGLIDVRVSLLQAQRSLSLIAAEEQVQHAALRSQLEDVLGLVLGGRPAGGSPLVLAQQVGGATAVKLDPKWEKVASASRTLQESVFLRARALLDAAKKAGRTELQDAVERSLEPMRVKRSERRPEDPEPALNRISARAWALLGRPQMVLAGAESAQVRVKIEAATSSTGDEVLDTARTVVLNTEARTALRNFLGEYYVRFDSFDQIGFPLYYDTGTGEPSTVEVVRVSPQDATSLIDETTDVLHRRKLGGTALANFGAFLDRRWRLNDIMWGRLDGVERFIQVLLPMSDDATVAVRRELIALAHGRILREALVPEGHKDLTDLLCNALQDMPDGDTEQRLNDLLAELKLGDAPSRDRLGGVLSSLLSEQGLMDYVREKRQVDPAPDPKTTLDSAARAVTITDRVLECISTQKGKGSLAPRWLTRLGLLLQGIVAVSLPGTFRHRWWTHGAQVLYAFEAVALVVAVRLGSADMRTLTIATIGVTLGVHLLTLIAGDLMRERTWWTKVAIAAALIVLFVLAPVGALALWKVSPKTLWCGEARASSSVAPSPPTSGVCAWLGSP